MFTLPEIIKAVNGRLIQGQDARTIKGVSIDSRSLNKGDVFIAIEGERFDGHRFVKDAVRKAAVALIVSKKLRGVKEISVVQVKDTTEALGRIAQLYRDRFSVPIIAVTGSVGKTTTKDLIAAVLKSKYKVLKTEGTQNNHYGVPLTLLKLKPSHEIVVLELGTNQTGDIARSAQISRPLVAVFTNIGESHLEKLKTKRGVLREKSQLLKYLQPKGVVILNEDDPLLMSLREATAGKCVGFSIKNSSSYQAKDISLQHNTKLEFRLSSKKFILNALGTHTVYNALAAIACARFFKLNYDDIYTKLNLFKFTKRRQEVKKIGTIWLIDDCYNSNPVSLKSAVTALASLTHKGKTILVCGDMLELGQKSVKLHQLMGTMIVKHKIDVTITFGRNAKYITEIIQQSKGACEAYHGRNLTAVYKLLSKHCRKHDAVLVKGSRAMRMERMVEYLNKNL